MGTCLTKIGHSCGSIGGLQVYERDDDTVDGFCWSCEEYVRHPYGEPALSKDVPRTKNSRLSEGEVAELIEMIHGLGSVDLPDRKLRKDALDQFGIKIGFSTADGVTPAFYYFPYYEGDKFKRYKVRMIEGKRTWNWGDSEGIDLFGWQQAVESEARRLIIVEGEFDAAALWRIQQMYCNQQYADVQPAVCSLPNGAASAHKDLVRLQDKIRRRFKEVTLCFDDDEPGRTATEKCMRVFPDCTAVVLPRNDANQCLLDGVGKAAYKAVAFNAEKPKNTTLVFGESLHDEAREQAPWGELSWPWPDLQEATRGIRPSTIYIGAGVKMGKSEIVNALGAHFIKNHGVKVFMAKPEEANKKTYKMMASKVVGKVFHDPKIEFDYEAYDKAGEVMHGKMAMVNLYQHLGWDTLKSDIYAAHSWGAKVGMIDPITNLTDPMSSGDANQALQAIAQELSAMALDLDMTFFIFCHLKAHEGNITREKREKLYNSGQYTGLGNCPHEFGGDIFSSQFAGSRAMMRKCDLMLGLEGNKDPDLPIEKRNRRVLKILEDREFGASGKFPLYWDQRTQLFIPA